jgi:Ca2+-binding RTX toxin-like protein
LAGVTDVDGQALTITAVSVASGGGSLVNNGNGTWTYTPAADFNGPVSFNYTASDGSLSASSTASLTLAAVNDAPTATNLSTTETYTQGVPLNLVDIVVSDVDSANVTATLTLSNVAAGSLSTATSGAVTSTYNAATGVWTASGAIANVNVLLAGLTLTPAANFNGSFSIATSISDGVAPAITGSKAFTGIAVNAPPTATNLSAAESYTEDTPLNLVDIVVSDVDSANVTATLTLSNVAAGSLSTATSGAVTSTYNVATGVWTASGAIANVNALLAGLTLTPAANFNGSFSIATSISDGVAPAITGSKAFTGIAVNDAPVATPVTLAAGTEDTAYTINAAALLAGVTDVDGQALTITSVSVASGGGSIVNNGNGTWTYTPAADFNGPVSFNYTASDGSLSASSTANVFISPVNDAPTATNLSTAETYTEDTPLNLVDIVVSDVDSANVTATLTLSNVAAGSLSTATSGAVTSTYNAATGVWTASGAIANVNALLAGLTLTPAANFNGSFSIATSISDGVAPAITGSKAFTGIAVNDAPVASPVTLTAGTANTQYTITAAMLLAGVTDVDGPSSSITSVTVASGGGSIVNNGGGNWTYTPVAGYVGPVSFNYVATDGSLTANSTANLTLNAPGIINGTAGADILVGTSQTDSIFGLAGNDIIKGLGGNDQIDGGTGRDVADYSDASDGVGITVDMAAGTVSGGASVGTDTLRSIENIRGTDFADTYVAIGFNQSSPNNAQDIPIQSTINNIFEGGGGNDTIIGSSGSQASYATGNGGTQISYAHALASVTVDLRDGTAFGTAANDVAHVGTDTFSQVSGVVGSDFNDTLLGSNSASHGDVFFGGAGNDFIDGRVGYDFVGYYANFNPASITSGITVNLAAGTVTGDASVGTDTLRSIEIVRGTQFDDIYNAAGFGLAGALNVSDMGSFNQFEGMGGNDTITGNGNTRIDYNFASASVTVDFQLGTAHSTAADDAGIGTDTFDTGVNSVRGSSFNDVLLGSGGNENFLGGRGDDLIDGRNGFDRAVYSTSSDDAVTSGITVNLAAGTVQGDASVGLDTLRSVEAIQGTDFADSYSATGFGITGNNVGNYGTFNEFEGGSGNDTITGNGNTRIAFYNAAAAVTVNLTTGISQGTAGGDLAAVGTDTFTGVTAIAGSSFADTFTGSDNAANTAEEFAGRGGNDTIDGRGGFDRAFYSDESTATGIQVNMASGTVTGDAAIGTDTLRSVEGIRGTNFADTYVATNFGVSGLNVGNFGTFNEFEGMRGNDSITGNGNTRIAFYNALAAVTVDLSLGISRGTAADDVAGVGTDGFTGVNAVRGSNFADTIFGDGNANALEGRDGDDQLDGRGGADTLTGGNGADTFIYGDGSGADTIADFNRVQGDLIDVSAVSAVASFADIQSRTTVVGGNTVIDFGNGNTLTLTGVTSIQQSDFVFRNVVNGTSAADVLLGTSRADAVFGLAGNDIIKGLEGDDQLDGGTGRDVADYSDATGAISVNMASGTVSGNASVGNDTLRSIESVRGTDFDDSYLATGFNQTSPNNAQDIQIQSNINNTFEGGGGNDTIVGSSGAQSSYSTGNGGTQVSYAHAAAAVIVDLRAGTARGIAANDVAHVGVDALQFVNGVVGSNFNDTLSGTDSAIHVDVFYGGQGDDTIDGRDGYDIVTYNPFFDASVITGPITVNLAAGTVAGDASVGTDTLRSVELVRGTSFNDVYNAAGFGSAGALNVSNTGTFNQFEGMAGNDTIIGNGNTRADYNFASAAVTVDLQLGSGRSTVADDAGVGIDTLDSGVNSARGSAFNDTLLGSSRNEYLLGGRGDDLIDGRNGFDRAVYSTASEDAVTSGIVVNLAAGTVQGDASVGTDTLRSIEGITGSDFADTFNATGYGLAGASNVGNNGTFNEIEGGGGNDSITGNGNTRIAFYNALDGVTVDLGGGTSRGTAANDLAQVGTDTFTGVSSVAGSAFDDTIAGSNNAANTAEDFGGREGNDFIDGLGGFDRAFYHNDSSTLSGINVNLAFGIVTGDATIGTDTLRSVEGIRGTNFADTFNASNFGAAGFLDALVNNVGNFGTFNEFEGMGGNDSITGNGNTRIAFYNAADGVTVDLAAGNSHGTAAADVAGVGTDTFSGVNAVRGSAFNDAVAGGSGNETLDGQGGDDVIQGRGGADTLIGGGGADRFVFNAISDSSIAASDTISDFVHGADVIDTFGISGITSVQGLISGSTQVAAHSIVWAQSGANTIVYMNSSGVAQDQSAADMRIVLTGVTASTLTSSDFFHF